MNPFIIKENTLVAYRGNETDVVIPDGVTVIGERVFQYFTNIRNVFIPDGVTVIGGNAFRGCSQLRSVTLPESLRVIGDSAFWHCSNLKNFKIPNGVTHIGQSAFCDCKQLTEISIPSGMTEICDSTFWQCNSLQRVTLSDSVRTVSDFAFAKCTHLRKLTLSENITSVMNSAFYDCEQLTLTIVGTPAFNSNAFEGVKAVVAPQIRFESFLSTESKMAAIRGYWEYREAFTDPQIRSSYRKYLNAHRKKFLPEIFQNDTVCALYFYADEKKIHAFNFEEEYLNPAIEQKATGCIAFLLTFRDKNIPFESPEEFFERELSDDLFQDEE